MSFRSKTLIAAALGLAVALIVFFLQPRKTGG
jgi:hypothetical protein